MDSRTARRAAEKAARDLIASRATHVGELGAATAERTALAAAVTIAADRGRQLVAAAEAEAARLVAAAEDHAQDGEQRYADAYSAATTAGWTSADLSVLGFQPVTATTARRRRAEPAAHSTPARPGAAPSAVPLQASPIDAG